MSCDGTETEIFPNVYPSCFGQCPSLSEAGPQGSEGTAGTDGSDGTDGSSAWTTTTAAFVQPAVNVIVSVSVLDSTWISVGQNIFVQSGGYYEVDSVPTSTSVVLKNLGTTGNAAPATNITNTKKVSPAGYNMPEAAMIANSIKANPTNASASPTDLAIAANQFPARAATGNLSAKTITNFILTLCAATTAALARGILAAAHELRALTGTKSITGGGDLTADRTFELDGDEAAPASYKYYGTDNSGNRGYHLLPMGAYTNCQVFESSGTWNKPSGITGHVLVYVTGAGGTGGGALNSPSNAGGGGESGSTGIGIISSGDLSASETITVGSAPGGTSSFGAFISAEGGGNGAAPSGSPANPAVAVGGNININGSSIGVGWPLLGVTQANRGGSSFWGCGPCCAYSNGTTGVNGRSATVWGCGGSGAFAGSSNNATRTGGAGYHGVVIIMWSEVS